jgi:hypothetical protein
VGACYEAPRDAVANDDLVREFRVRARGVGTGPELSAEHRTGAPDLADDAVLVGHYLETRRENALDAPGSALRFC